ncbi:MAG: type II toxin-antitoxin system PemK/MazF family toxin [Chlamydiales bacterium]|nr:type II toxin-antitoxin system PemK/MazF family toxin [Chlamydiales bacterium]
MFEVYEIQSVAEKYRCLIGSVGDHQLGMVLMTGKNFPRRGEVYWTNLDPNLGSETKKRRLGLIVSSDIGNELSIVVDEAIKLVFSID